MIRQLRKIATPVLAASLIFQVTAANAFDFDTGKAPLEVVIPTVLPVVLSEISPTGSDASVVLRVTSTVSNSFFDAIAPYHPTAVGVYSRLGRRPASEAATNRNKNIAIIYSSYRVLNSLLPKQRDKWRGMLTSVGLDPDDTRENTTTPIGIGNLAGKAIVAFKEHDGMNQLGDVRCKYNCLPYADYTGYKPVNTAYTLNNPGRWQPLLGSTGNGLFRIQQFVTPQWAVTKAFTYRSAVPFTTPPPTASNPHNYSAYKQQADEVLQASAELTDHQKMVAERFNHKLFSLGFAEQFIVNSRNFDLDKTIHFIFMNNVAAWDGGIAAWRQKYIHDAVRPGTAIKYLYGNNPVTAWGGPGKGTVTDLPASQWRAYLNTADHPEYPSGSSCFCAAHAQASRRYLGSDTLGWTINIPKGSSFVEPGITPATDITIGWRTYTEFENECGMSRVWGGVHFQAAVDAGNKMCRQMGDRAFEFIKRHVNGST